MDISIWYMDFHYRFIESIFERQYRFAETIYILEEYIKIRYGFVAKRM